MLEANKLKSLALILIICRFCFLASSARCTSAVFLNSFLIHWHEWRRMWHVSTIWSQPKRIWWCGEKFYWMILKFDHSTKNHTFWLLHQTLFTASFFWRFASSRFCFWKHFLSWYQCNIQIVIFYFKSTRENQVSGWFQKFCGFVQSLSKCFPFTFRRMFID